jgi:DNA-binding transcriptional MocR family regulator
VPTALANSLSGLILDGRLPVGTRLPAERIMADVLHISRASVVAALNQLRSRDLLSTRHGAGSLVRLPPHTALASVTAWTAAGGTPGAAHVHDEIDWSAATPPAASPAILRAYEQALTRLPFAGTGYSAAGLPELRTAIADRYTSSGLDTSPDQICVTAGAQQALSLLLEQAVQGRGRVLLETPTYPGFLDLLRARPAQLTCVPVEDTWSMSALTDGLRDPTVQLAYLMPRLHNPTSQTMSDEQQESVCEAAARSGALIILDDTLADLTEQGGSGPLATHRAARLVRVGSLSKTAWGGLRVGWVRSDRATAQLLARARTRVDLGTPVLEQLAATAVLAQYDDVLHSRRQQLHAAAARLTSALAERIPTLTVPSAPAGPSLWCRLPTGISSTAITAAAHHRGLRLTDVARFSPHNLLSSALRLPLDIPEHALATAVDRLALALDDCAHRSGGRRQSPRGGARR